MCVADKDVMIIERIKGGYNIRCQKCDYVVRCRMKSQAAYFVSLGCLSCGKPMKACTTCGEVKPYDTDNFTINNGNITTLSGMCKDCRRKIDLANYHKNKEEICRYKRKMYRLKATEQY